jgi:hypothetical protein
MDPETKAYTPKSSTKASKVLAGQANAAAPTRSATTPLPKGAHQFPEMRESKG